MLKTAKNCQKLLTSEIMNKSKIYIIAFVSSVFVGVSVGAMVAETSKNVLLGIIMGFFGGLGSMMIELTVPETLIATWQRANWWYRILAAIATIISPTLLIAALPYEGISRWSVAFIVAALITYIAFYAKEKMGAEEAIAKRETNQQIEYYQQEKITRLQAELDLQKQKQLAEIETERQERLAKLQAAEDRKTQKALAKLANRERLTLSREAVIEIIRNEQTSWRELGRRFGVSPQKVMGTVDDLIEGGIISTNGHGVSYNG